LGSARKDKKLESSGQHTPANIIKSAMGGDDKDGY
jgi:hypothetical protein